VGAALGVAPQPSGTTSAKRPGRVIEACDNYNEWTWLVAFQTLLQVTIFSLSHWVTGEIPYQAVSTDGPAPDGRRPFGSVRDAIVQVLATEPLGLRARDVHAHVELLLAEPVSRSSVKSTLALRCVGSEPLFVRVGRGRYLLAKIRS
jgi:hypothetical protein